MTPVADFIVMLTSKGLLATKRISRHPDGGLKVLPCGSAKRFSIATVPVSSIYDLAAFLDAMATWQCSCVVHGRPAEGVNAADAFRRLHPRKRPDGTVEPATLEPATHYWVLLDVDSLACPPWLDPLDEPDHCVEFVVSHLPPAFHAASAWWQFTAKQGIAPGIHMRLAFWSDRLVSCDELKVLLAPFPVDLAIYTPTQPVYVAHPARDVGIPDPVPPGRRSGIWAGDRDAITLPPVSEGSRARTSAWRRTFTGEPGQTYTQHRDRIGDHEGGAGFHGPVGSAIYRFFYEHGPETDAVWLRADLEDAISAAVRTRHDDGYIERRVLDLDSWIEWTRQQEREKAASQALPIEPTYPAPLGSVAEARAVLAHQVRAFAGEVRAYHALVEKLEAPAGDEAPDLPTRPVRVLLVGVGIGKTKAAREELLAPLVAEGLPVVFSVPRHKLGDEIVDDLLQDGALGRVYRGREADDPDVPGEKMCREHERAAAIVAASGNVNRHACRDRSPGGAVCEYFSACGYQRQQRDPPPVWLIPHHLLRHKRPGFIAKPAVLVLDEAFHGPMLHGTDKPVWLDLAGLLGDRTVPSSKSAAASAAATADLIEVSNRAYRALTAGPEGWVRLGELQKAGLTADDLRNALKLEWRREATLDGVEPGMPRAAALKLIKRAAAHNQRVARLARLWRLLARQIEEGHERSPWLSFDRQAPLHGDETGPRVRMTWRSDIHQSWQAPTLVLDATLQPDITRVFFPQMPDPVLIDAPLPHTKVRQIVNRPMARAMFVCTKDVSEAHNASRRNNLEKLRKLIEVRTADVAQGRGVLICQERVEKGLKAGPLPGNVDVVHFNAIRGLNDWNSVAWLAVVGRTEPSPRDVELISRTLFGVDVQEIQPDENGDVRYPRIVRGIRMRDGAGRRVEGNQHPDPRAEAIRFGICEAELVVRVVHSAG